MIRRLRASDSLIGWAFGIMVAAVVGTILGFLFSQQGQIDSLSTTVSTIVHGQQQNAPKIKSSAKNSAAAAKAAADAEGVVSEIPAFVAGVEGGQGKINTAILWADCELYYGPRACGPPPPLPGVTPVTTTTTTTAPQSSTSTPRSSNRQPALAPTPGDLGAPGARPSPAPPQPGHGKGKAKGHGK